MKQYIINEDDLIDLLRESQLLLALSVGGINNWDGFAKSIKNYETYTECDIYDVTDELCKFSIYKDDMDEAKELYNELDNISKT